MLNTQTAVNSTIATGEMNIARMTRAELGAFLFARGVGNGKIARLTDDELREYAMRIKDIKEAVYG